MTYGEQPANVAVSFPPFANMGGYGMGGCGGDWVALIVLAALFGGFGGNGGWGGGGNGFQQGFNTQNILSKLDGITNGICDGFYATATNSLQAQNQLQRDLCQGFSATAAQITENRFAAQQCCCETQRQIESLKYENSIMQNANTQRIIDKLSDMEVAKKDEKIADLTLKLSQIAQNTYLLDKLQPTPQPAYVVQNPNCCYNSCGYNSFGAFA
jgi:hypothetical protein